MGGDKSRSPIATVDDLKKLYSDFDLCDPRTSVSMTINGPAPMLLAFFMNAAIDQQVEKHLKATGQWEAAQQKIDAYFAGRERPRYEGALPAGNDGLGLGLLGISGDQVVDADTYAAIRTRTLASVRGTVQADILKEDQAQNTCIFSTGFAPRMMGVSGQTTASCALCKTHPNSVAAFDERGAQIGIVFQTATPLDTPRLMTELVTWVNQERATDRLHPLLVIAICVVVFLEIHPFQDGNGRLSRVLTTLLLLQAGYDYVPYSSLEGVVEQSKESYYLALRQTQTTIRTEAPDWQPWLVYFLRSLAEQARRLQNKVERERMVLATMPELQLRIVEFAREHGRITIGAAIKLTGASRNTLKQHFRALVERGALNRHGSGRGVWYELR